MHNAEVKLDKKVIAIVQARMGSARFPDKMLADIHGRPLLAILYERLRRSHRLCEVVIATSGCIKDDRLVEYCRNSGIPYFRGSETDL